MASFCCLPAAVAVALGLGLGTVAALGGLLAYQRLFQIAGFALSGLAAWSLSNRNCTECNRTERGRPGEGVAVYVLGAFAVSFLILNVVIIPLLEHLPLLLPMS